jgi:hypothetical protein
MEETEVSISPNKCDTSIPIKQEEGMAAFYAERNQIH